MRKTTYLFKEIGDIKGTFYARMKTIKNRNSKDLMEAEEMAKIHSRTIQNSSMPQITTMLWSLIYSQTPWSVKLSGP